MSEIAFHISGLIQKYLRNELTSGERQELQRWIDTSEENRLVIQELTNEEWVQAELDKFNKYDIQVGRQKIALAAPEQIAEHSAPVHRIHFLKTSWFRYAAAVILLLGAGSYLWFSNKKTEIATTNGNKHLQTDIAPGSNKAVLTLANGQQIILDNTANGNIAQQGNTKITKLDAGQLAYNAGNNLSKEILYNTISTPRGGQYQIVLPDGSKVWLNAASSIKFPAAFTGTERNVNVTGEAYLEVAKNLKHPFSVNVNGAEIQVLGTSFNINAYEDEKAIKTTLIEGSVKIKAVGKEVILKPASSAVVVSSDQQMSARGGSPAPGAILIQVANTDEILAWKNGLFNFNHTDLSAVMRQLSRWYDVTVEYKGDVPRDKFVGKIPRSMNLSDVLKVLQLSNVHFTVEGKKIIVTL